MKHDPLCRWNYGLNECRCDLIARVREDEREKARIDWGMSNGPAFDFARGFTQGQRDERERIRPLVMAVYREYSSKAMNELHAATAPERTCDTPGCLNLVTRDIDAGLCTECADALDE